MAGAFLIQLPDLDSMPARTLKDGVSAMVVYAATSADALAVAKAMTDSDMHAMWGAADITPVAAATSLDGFTLKIRLYDPADEINPVVNVSLDIDETLAPGVKATGTLTLTPGAIADDVVKIDTTYYKFAADPTTGTPDGTVGNPYLVAVAGSNTAALANLRKAINATGTGGVDYAAEITVHHATVEATASDATTLSARARTSGTAGNSISTTVTATGGADGLAWGATTLTGGLDGASTDTVAAAAVTALNATTPIAGAAYNSTTQVLTVAETTDSLGDHTLVVELIPPGANENISVPGYFSTIVDEGASGAAVKVTLGADAYVLPNVTAQLGQV